MPRAGRFALLCLLLVLLPLRSLLAAGQLGCEPVPVPTQERTPAMTPLTADATV